MTTNQIYTIVNEVNSQAMGSSAIAAVDTSTFVAMGNAILSSSANTEGFLNTLAQRITKTIILDRVYRSRFRALMVDEMHMGAILQKIWVEMPETMEDASIPLTNGESVDQWILMLPKVHQKLFVKRPTFQLGITIQRKWLREAFLSEGAMDSFIGAIFQACQNRIEQSVENLAKGCINNMIAQVAYANGTATITNGKTNAAQVINLVSLYNAERGTLVEWDETGTIGESAVDVEYSKAAVPTGLKALYRKDFVQWAIGYINQLSDNLETLSEMYNLEGAQRHTPKSLQLKLFLSRFTNMVDTMTRANVIHNEFSAVTSDISVPYWQGSGTSIGDFESQSNIDVKIEDQTSGATADVNLSNVIGMIVDRDGIGCYRKIDDVRTTTLNARGAYYNTFWDLSDMYINVTSENCLVFTLN